MTTGYPANKTPDKSSLTLFRGEKQKTRFLVTVESYDSYSHLCFRIAFLHRNIDQMSVSLHTGIQG